MSIMIAPQSENGNAFLKNFCKSFFKTPYPKSFMHPNSASALDL